MLPTLTRNFGHTHTATLGEKYMPISSRNVVKITNYQEVSHNITLIDALPTLHD